MCVSLSNRGDDLGQLTETTWPNLYVPKPGIGDFTGKCDCVCFFIVILTLLIISVAVGIFSDDDVAEDKSNVDTIAEVFAKVKHALETVQAFVEFMSERADDVCKAMPENPCAGASLAIACFPNPVYYVCRVVKITTSLILQALLVAASMAFQIVEEQYLNAMKIGDSTVYYGYYYSRAAFFNEMGHAEWNAKALEAIRVNMKDQHMQMKFQLQERHKDIANHVGQDVREKCCLVYRHLMF